ncbi:MAG: hypothetical protein U5N55_10305 [Cypionkella sp.]|nr:hypothetical protein [Cypionkella sp.]
MRAFTTAIAALGLAACSPAVPDSGLGVGFQDYDSYLKNRQAALAQPLSAGTAVLPPAGAAQPSAGFSTAGAAAAIAGAQQGNVIGNPLAPRSLQEQAAQLGGGQVAAPVLAQPAQQVFVPPAPIAPVPQTASAPARVIGSAAAPVISSDELAAVRPRGNAPAGISETVSEMAVVGGVSDEQDFEAVAARETIESDKARIEKNRAQYQIDQPGALPQRAGVGPSIVEYALATQHPVGVKLFRRSPLRFKKQDAACAPYANDDLAQEAFLAAGGPDRDKLGMDPDGDGYACGWSPAPYRAVVP